MKSATLLLSSSLTPVPKLYSGSHSSFLRGKLGIVLALTLFTNSSRAQQSSGQDLSFARRFSASTSYFNPVQQDSLTKKQKTTRQWIVGTANVVGYGGSLIILSSAWYKGYPKTSFHTFNDSKEWLQVDKFGHAWTSYNAGRVSAAMWKWAGLPEKKAAWIGALSSTAYLIGIEFMDGHSAKWGWSWSDIAANFAGAGLYLSQQLGWGEQRIQYKFSFHRKDYSEPMLEERADDLFGESWYERMLKDYNAQTYWFSANLKSFFPKSNLPPWLNISIGYGADGMFGGFENKWTDESGATVDRTDIPRLRQFYLAPDVNFSKIKTNKKWLRTIFTLLDAFKCPAPAIMIDTKGKLKAYAIYF